MPVYWTEEEILRVKAIQATGRSAAEASRIMGKPVHGARHHYKNTAIINIAHFREWTDQETETLRQMANDGDTHAEMAKRLDRTEGSVLARCHKLKIKRVLRKVWSDDDKELVRKMVADGMSYTAIGEHFGRSKRSAIGIAWRMGLIRGEAAKTAKPFAPKMTQRRAEYVPYDNSKVNIQRFDMARIPSLDRYRIKNSEPKLLTQRTFGDCCFPVGGDGEDTLYCCEPVKVGKHYCKKHYRVMYVMRT